MNRPNRRLLALALAAAAACPVRAQDVYRGLCDASAAAAIGGGHFVVADDESDVLRVYRRSSAQPVAEVDLIDYLHNRKPNGKNDEADIEGAAAVGERIYWIGSHGRKGGDGSVDRHRWRFFATNVVRGSATAPPTVKPAAGAPYETLLDDLLADPRFGLLVEAASLKPEDAGGLNIEGLAATPDGGLLIGFRNPRPGGYAIVVPLRNPREVIDGGAKPAFGDLVRLDLGGRGIRSLERVGDGYLIVAGPHGDAAGSQVKPDFALFRWAASLQQAPAFVRSLDAGSFRAEALFFDPEAKDLYLLSDDGDERVGGRDCKDKAVPPADKSFRAMALKTLSAAAAAPGCTVERSAAFGGETVLLARRQGLDRSANLGLFKAPLAVNTDGAPTSYHPDDFKGERLAINRIDNGIAISALNGSPLTTAERIEVFDRWRQSGDWTVPAGFRIVWRNVIAAEGGKPCVFRHSNAGYFGSLTALRNGVSGAAAGECSVNDQIDQRFVPAIVLRGGGTNPLRGWGASVGDLVLAVNPATGVTVPAVIGDTGDGKRIGEGSVALNAALLTGARLPTTYREALALDTGTRDMLIAVLPASKLFERERPYSRDNIAKRVESWAARHGYGSLQELSAAALACARSL